MKNILKSKLFVYLIDLLIISFIFSIIFFKYLNLNEYQLPILMYHHVLPEKDIEKYFNDSDYVISSELFEEEMKYLYENGYRTIGIDEFVKWKKGGELPSKSVMITIDDGCTSLREYIDPILKKYNFTAVSFIVSDRVGEITKEFDASVVDYVGKDFLNNKTHNFEIGSHSHSMHHLKNEKPYAGSLNKDEIIKDLDISYNILNTNIFSYPFSYFDKNMISALRNSKFNYALRGHNKKCFQNEHDYLNSRIGDIYDMKSFRSIFETDKYNQTILDKIKGIWIKIKYGHFNLVPFLFIRLFYITHY